MKIAILLSLLFSAFTYAQQIKPEFGILSTEEVEMQKYKKDTSAKAVVLFDKGNTVFFETKTGYDIRFTRHKRIKIFDKSESKPTEISLPFYSAGNGRTESIKSLEAVTYNFIDGQVFRTVLKPSAVFEERINEHWYNKKFIFPNVQDGAIIEYRYELETPFHFNLPDWNFQDRIPTLYSEYEVSMIPFYEYVYLVQGIEEFDYQNSIVADKKRSWGSVMKSMGRNVGNGVEFQDIVHTYILKDIPAFKDESYISSINDYIIKMDFQLAKFYDPQGGSFEIISTWPDLNRALLKHDNFGKYLNNSSRIAKKILSEEISLTGKDQTENAREIIEYVKENFKWNEFYDKYTSQSPKDFYKSKLGNSADINLLMIAILNEAGIEAKPLILSTRNHGKIPTAYPFDHFTNYVIAFVESETPFLADGTEILLSFDKIPTRCNNGTGLIVEKEDSPRWIRLDNHNLSLKHTSLQLELDSVTNDLSVLATLQHLDYESYFTRKKFRNDEEKIKGFYSDKIGEVLRMRTNGFQKNNLPYFLNFETHYETEKLNNNVIIYPFLKLPISQNSLTQAQRTYPVDFMSPWGHTFETQLIMPENYELLEIPADYFIDDELAEISLEYLLHENILTIKGKYKFKKPTYESSEYPRIKMYLDTIVELFNEPVVVNRN